MSPALFLFVFVLSQSVELLIFLLPPFGVAGIADVSHQACLIGGCA
jgi:hypothetical protein